MAPVVTIPGFERPLPQKFSFNTEQIDIQARADANQHNEIGAFVECSEDAGFNDKMTVSGWSIPKGYQLDIKFQSEAGIQVFRDGRFVFDFDSAAQEWSLKAYVRGKEARREWAFCDAEAAIDVVTSALDCYQNSAPESDATLAIAALLASIEEQRDLLVESVAQYQDADDCNAIPDPNDNVPIMRD